LRFLRIDPNNQIVASCETIPQPALQEGHIAWLVEKAQSLDRRQRADGGIDLDQELLEGCAIPFFQHSRGGVDQRPQLRKFIS
jgi:hypothetical protein